MMLLLACTMIKFFTLKTLFNFKAINITIGLPFIRVSPDHGPNVGMYKNLILQYIVLEFLIKSNETRT